MVTTLLQLTLFGLLPENLDHNANHDHHRPDAYALPIHESFESVVRLVLVVVYQEGDETK